jgi:hypothetical protein
VAVVDTMLTDSAFPRRYNHVSLLVAYPEVLPVVSDSAKRNNMDRGNNLTLIKPGIQFTVSSSSSLAVTP